MKIIITLDEIKKLIASQHGISNDFTLEVSNPFETFMQNLILHIGVNIDKPNTKITHIKKLREIAGDVYGGTLGLAEAKWAIEHWNDFYLFLQINKRFPKFVSHDNYSSYKLE